jgi:hypothetical protein
MHSNMLTIILLGLLCLILVIAHIITGFGIGDEIRTGDTTRENESNHG